MKTTFSDVKGFSSQSKKVQDFIVANSRHLLCDDTIRFICTTDQYNKLHINNAAFKEAQEKYTSEMYEKCYDLEREIVGIDSISENPTLEDIDHFLDQVCDLKTEISALLEDTDSNPPYVHDFSRSFDMLVTPAWDSIKVLESAGFTVEKINSCFVWGVCFKEVSLFLNTLASALPQECPMA